VLGGDEWSSPVYPYGSDGALLALKALAATGASHVRLLVSGYLDNAFTATRVYSVAPPSALATASVASLQAVMAQATALGLAPVLCPVLDPNWDTLPPVSRSTVNNPNGTWRGTIGSKYTTQAEFDAFFASYRAWAWPYYQAAAAAGAAMIEVSSELDYLFGAPQAEAGWRERRALPFRLGSQAAAAAAQLEAQQMLQAQAQMSEAEWALQDAEERERDILQIAKEVSEVADMFKDLNALVVTQGESIERIEERAVEAAEHAKKGVEEVREANRKQRHSQACAIA
jgi:hypothetical protein